jgi:hypothetical protein
LREGQDWNAELFGSQAPRGWALDAPILARNREWQKEFGYANVDEESTYSLAGLKYSRSSTYLACGTLLSKEAHT